MNPLYGIVAGSAPLLLASFGALISEYAGCMALFLDGIINLGAFLCFAFTVTTNSSAAGMALSIVICVCCIASAGIITERFHANAFLAALALNLLTSALASALSAKWFGTRGILTSASFIFDAGNTRLFTTIIAYVLVAAGWMALRKTRQGLYIRITGSDADVLAARGISAAAMRVLAWSVAAFFGGAAGCVLVCRLSSFVPNISSGTGWTALAAVFLGKKSTAAISAAVLVFAAAEYGASNMQNIPCLRSVPSAVLLSLPYITALLLILLTPEKQK